MMFLKAGFLFAIGWYVGTNVARVLDTGLDRVLDRRSKWYRKATNRTVSVTAKKW